MKKNTRDTSLLNKKMYIVQAALEYLISILVTGSFLATLTGSIGISDSFTGILSATISLGCLFQFFSLLIPPSSRKRFVIIMSVLNQGLFLLLYLVPQTGLSPRYKTIAFSVLIFSAYLIYYVAHPKKIDWLMSNVNNRERGIFTANKEIISLISGAVFSLAAGAVIDRLLQNDKSYLAFTVCAFTIAAFSLIHTICLLKTTDSAVTHKAESKKLFSKIRAFTKNKKLIKTVIIIGLYYVSTYLSTPFFGVYQVNELGLNLKTIAVLALLESISRIIVSRKWGRYADSHSFSVMIKKCFCFLAASYLCIGFAFLKTGVIAFTLYYILRGIAMGGVNSAVINLIYESTPLEDRSDALAVCQAISGVIGFCTTLLAGIFVDYMQKNNNTVFSLTIYAPQILSVLSFVCVIAAIVYISFNKKQKSS